MEKLPLLHVGDLQTPLRRRLLNTVRQRIIPTLEGSNLWQTILAQPPFQFPREISIDYHSGKPLLASQATSYGTNDVVHYWPSAKVHNSRLPYMGFVLEGEIDWRIGITAEVAKTCKKEFAHSDYALLRIPKSTFFLMPPGIPYSSGELSHWEASAPPKTPFQIFWVHFIPQGVLCHFCWMTSQGKISETHHYIPDSQLLFAATALIDELQQRGPNAPQATGSLLLFIFHRIAYGLVNLKEQSPGIGRPFRQCDESPHTIVGLACQYIDSHLHEKLSMEDIAKASLVSPSYLSRVFKAKSGMTVNEYVTHFRLERACSLLQGSKLMIDSVAHSIGYSSSAYFCRLFVRHFGCPPLQFRQNHLQEYYNKSIKFRKSQK